MNSKGQTYGLHRFKATVVLCALILATPVCATTPEQKQFKTLTQVTVSVDREPIAGSVRSNKNQTDLRSTFEAPDGRELTVTIWSPRVHPFKEPPQYKAVRRCISGEYFESTIGISDITKSHILKKIGQDINFSQAYEWDDKQLSLSLIPAPEKAPQKSELIGKLSENEKTGVCEYQPMPMRENENAKYYFHKHLEIAVKANVTDILFPKTTFNFISLDKQDFTSDYIISLSGIKDLNIDFKGSTFLLPPRSGAFLLRGNQRIAFRKLNLEWAKPTEKQNLSYGGTSLHGFYAPKSNNTDLWFDELNLKRVPGWAFYFDSVRGASIANSNIAPLSEDSISAARDGAIHAINSQDLVIRNNSFVSLGGDGIAIHGQMAVVSRSLSSSSDKNEEKTELSCVGLGSHWGPFAKDETLAFFNGTLGFQGEMQIKKIEQFSPTDTNLPEYCRGFAYCSHACFLPHPDFSPIQGGFASSATHNSSLFIIYGNKLSEVKGRAILVQGSNGDISENIISHAGGPGIQLSADLANQLQGPGAYNILLKNNRLHQVATSSEFLKPTEPIFGGLALAATRKEFDGRVLISPAPLVQHIRIEGSNSTIENTGSVALQITSAREVDVKSLSIGTAGVSRDLSSGSLSGESAEGSVLITKSTQVDLSGLTAPPLSDFKMVRNRTIVVDSQSVSHIKLPLISKGIIGKTANTLWYTTFRSWFKNVPSREKSQVEFKIESPEFSTMASKFPVEAFPIIFPKLGDQETASIGDAIPITQKFGQWSSSVDMDWQSPNRVQLRPKINKRILDLTLSIERIHLSPKKLSPLPYES